MSAQEAPDGTSWAQRKVKSRRKMMAGLRLGKRLKVQSSTQHVQIGWTSRAGGIARVHHYGLRDRVSKRGVRVKYEERQLLGLSHADTDMVSEIIEDMVAGN